MFAKRRDTKAWPLRLGLWQCARCGYQVSVTAGNMYCGFYVEKGLGLRFANVEPHYTLGTEWLWSEFVTGIAQGFPAVSGDEILTVWVGPFYRRDEIPPSQSDLYRYSRVCFAVRNRTELEPMAPELNPAQPEFTEYLGQTIANRDQCGVDTVCQRNSSEQILSRSWS